MGTRPPSMVSGFAACDLREHDGGVRETHANAARPCQRHRDVGPGRHPPTPPQRQESTSSAGPAKASNSTQVAAIPTIAPPIAASVSGATTRAAGTASSTTATVRPQATAKFAMPPPMASAPGPRRNTRETNAATGRGEDRSAAGPRGARRTRPPPWCATAMTTSAIACVYATSSGPIHVSPGR